MINVLKTLPIDNIRDFDKLYQFHRELDRQYRTIVSSLENVHAAVDTNSTPTFQNLHLTGLTSSRIPYVTTGGLLTDSPYLTFSSNILNAYNETVSNQLKLTGSSITDGAKVVSFNESDIGNSWSKINSIVPYDIKCSDTGRTVIITYPPGGSDYRDLRVSNDYGVTFNIPTTWPAIAGFNGAIDANNTADTAVSNSGQYMLATCQKDSTVYLYKSSNYGLSFSIANAYTSDTCNIRHNAISGDAHYQYQLIFSNDANSNMFLIRSDDYGNVWSNIYTYHYNNGTYGTLQTYSMVADKTGQHVVIVTNIYVNSLSHQHTGIFISSDYGLSFSLQVLGDIYSTDSLRGYTTCISDNGNVIGIACASTGKIIISTNGGTSWSVSSATYSGCRSICCSADGKYITFTVSTGAGATYVSLDYGATWSLKVTQAGTLCSCMSSDGTIQYTGNYTSSTYGIQRSSTYKVESNGTNNLLYTSDNVVSSSDKLKFEDSTLKINGSLNVNGDMVLNDIFISNVSQGLNPISVNSTTLCLNLNADLWDSQNYPITTVGDLFVGGTAGIASRLAVGTASQVLIGGSTPTWTSNLPSMTMNSAYVYRAGGTDVPVADGGTGLSAIALGSVLVANTANIFTALTSISGTKVLTNTAGVISWATSTGGGGAETDPIAMAYLDQVVKVASSPTFEKLTLNGADTTVDPPSALTVDYTLDNDNGYFDGTGVDLQFIVYAYKSIYGIYDSVGTTITQTIATDTNKYIATLNWVASSSADGYIVYSVSDTRWQDVGNVITFDINADFQYSCTYGAPDVSNTTRYLAASFNGDCISTLFSDRVMNISGGEINGATAININGNLNCQEIDATADINLAGILTTQTGFTVSRLNYLGDTDITLAQITGVVNTASSTNSVGIVGQHQTVNNAHILSGSSYAYLQPTIGLMNSIGISGNHSASFSYGGYQENNVGLLNAINGSNRTLSCEGIPMMSGLYIKSYGVQNDVYTASLTYNHTGGTLNVINCGESNTVTSNYYSCLAGNLNVLNYGSYYVLNGGGTGSGLTTKQYAIYINTVTGGDENWGIYDVSGANSYFNGALGIGTTTLAAKLHIIATSNQFRVGYDTSNYIKASVASTGLVTIDGAGSSAGIKFAKPCGFYNTSPVAQPTSAVADTVGSWTVGKLVVALQSLGLIGS